MSARLNRGRDRFTYRDDPFLLDALKELAADAGLSLTDWVRGVFVERLAAAGRADVVEEYRERRRAARFTAEKKPRKGRRG